MRFYRVYVTIDHGVSGGSEWFATKRKAEKRARDYPEGEEPYVVEEVFVEPTKAGILAALNQHASHPDNG